MITDIVKYIPEKETSVATVEYFLAGAWDCISYEDWSKLSRPSFIDYPFVSLRPQKTSDKLDKLTVDFYKLWDNIINKTC